MKKILLLLLVPMVFACCNQQSCTVDTKDYYGTITGLSETDGGKIFEMVTYDGEIFSHKYKETILRVGDHIKYTTPNDTCNCHLGTIINYGAKEPAHIESIQKPSQPEENSSTSPPVETDDFDWDNY